MRCHLLRKNILSVILVLFALPGSAQIIDKWKGKNALKVMEGTVLVQVAQSDSFNARVADAFQKYWKTSPYEMFDPARTYKSDDKITYSTFKFSIFSLVMQRELKNESLGPVGPSKRYTVETSQNYPFFLFGKSSQTGNMHGEELIGAFPLNTFHYEFNVNADYKYEGTYLRMPYIIYNLNDMVAFLKNKGTEKDYYKYIENKSPRIAKKTLIIPKDLVTEWDVNPNTTAVMQNNFKKKKPMKAIMHQILDQGDISFGGKYKVMTIEQIIALEKSPDASKYTLFLPAINDQKYMLVFDLDTKELLYYERTKMSMKIKDKDFDKLNKAAGL